MESNIDDFALANLLISKIENCDVALGKEKTEEKKESIIGYPTLGYFLGF